MIASLGMYDIPETSAATDAYWALIRDAMRDHGLAAPQTLTLGEEAYWPAWQSPDLVLSQTCGLPYRAKLAPHVTLIGTPDFGVEGCAPGYYNSVFVARIDDPRADLPAFSGARFAYNDGLSQSGWAAPLAWFQAHGLNLSPHLHTASHANSARAVTEGGADFAAIDAVTWRLLCRHTDLGQRLQVLGTTFSTPGLPYIAAKGADATSTFAAIAGAIAALTAQDRDTLMIEGLIQIPAKDYLSVPIPQSPDHFAQRD
jgi:ABC-type phosphate/phosphonate transport system substrate-binding protein